MKNCLFVLLSGLIILFSACNKDDSTNSDGNAGTTVQTTLTGRVLDQNGQPVAGATIACGGQTTTSNLWGLFTLEDVRVPSSRAIVRVNGTGYWDYTGSVRPLSGTATRITISLYSSGSTHTLNAMSGGTITSPNGGSITFPPDAIEDFNGNTYTGSFALTVHTLSPFESYFHAKLPGSDGRAQTSTDELTHLAPYATLGVEMTGSGGSKLRLKAGKKATITMPIASKLQSIAPGTIALWHFNETTGLWEEGETAQRIGNNYTGEVSHFSWWCYSDPDAVEISGTFTNCLGAPMAFAGVQVDTGYYLTDSDINGYYYFYVAPSITFNMQGIYWGWNLDDSTALATVPGQAPMGSYTVPTLQFADAGCETIITGQIVNCTGTPVNATVVLVQNNQMVDYLYTSNGIYTFYLPDSSNGNFTIFAYKGVYSNTSNINVIPLDYYYTGNITLCDITPVNNNVVLNFNSPITGNLPLSFDVSSAQVLQNAGHYEITVNYIDSATQTNGVFKIITGAYAPGIYNWNGTSNTISGTLSFAGISYSVQPSATSGTNTLNNTPLTGGNIIGQFSGPVTLTTTGMPTITGTLSGSFDVMRTP